VDGVERHTALRNAGAGEFVEVVPLGHGRYRVVTGARAGVAYAAAAGGATWVFLDGQTYIIQSEVPADRRRVSQADDEVALAAPMPATVVALNVGTGQSVKRGDVLVTLEAMKMELAVRAPRDGTVRRVRCRAGELVQAGVPLVELE
jgi:biotin carboxyl carrier protein